MYLHCCTDRLTEAIAIKIVKIMASSSYEYVSVQQRLRIAEDGLCTRSNVGRHSLLHFFYERSQPKTLVGVEL